MQIGKKSGLERISYTKLRDTYAYLLIRKNIPINQVQTLLGHSEVKQTMLRYGHLIQDKDIIPAINKLFNEKYSLC